MHIPSEALKDRWLEAALPLVATGGWTREVLGRAANLAGLSQGERALAAPGGVNDLIDHFIDRACERMRQALAAEDLSGLRVHQKVARGLKLWLAALEPDRRAVARAGARGMLPWGTGAATLRLWHVADVIWTAAGDTAIDYNRQTKRVLLSGVIPSIVARWLTDPGEAAMDRHIERRLKQAMQLGQAGSRIAKPLLDRLSRQS